MNPIHAANYYFYRLGHILDVHVLLRNGANSSLLTDSNDTALHLASRNGYFEIVNLLLSNGVDINAINAMDRTPLHESARNGHYFEFNRTFFF